MLSTGEVAFLGKIIRRLISRFIATGFKVKNKCPVLISIGSLKDKELFQSIQN